MMISASAPYTINKSAQQKELIGIWINFNIDDVITMNLNITNNEIMAVIKQVSADLRDND